MNTIHPGRGPVDMRHALLVWLVTLLVLAAGAGLAKLLAAGSARPGQPPIVAAPPTSVDPLLAPVLGCTRKGPDSISADRRRGTETRACLVLAED